MKGKKVVIWVDEHHREVNAWGSADVFEAIQELLMDIPGEVGELVAEDDRQWGGYRRIVIHISPPICQHPECGEALRSGETTECSWHAEEEGEE